MPDTMTNNDEDQAYTISFQSELPEAVEFEDGFGIGGRGEVGGHETYETMDELLESIELGPLPDGESNDFEDGSYTVTVDPNDPPNVEVNTKDRDEYGDPDPNLEY